MPHSNAMNTLTTFWKELLASLNFSGCTPLKAITGSLLDKRVLSQPSASRFLGLHLLKLKDKNSCLIRPIFVTQIWQGVRWTYTWGNYCSNIGLLWMQVKHRREEMGFIFQLKICNMHPLTTTCCPFWHAKHTEIFASPLKWHCSSGPVGAGKVPCGACSAWGCPTGHQALIMWRNRWTEQMRLVKYSQ